MNPRPLSSAHGLAHLPDHRPTTAGPTRLSPTNRDQSRYQSTTHANLHPESEANKTGPNR